MASLTSAKFGPYCQLHVSNRDQFQITRQRSAIDQGLSETEVSPSSRHFDYGEAAVVDIYRVSIVRTGANSHLFRWCCFFFHFP